MADTELSIQSSQVVKRQLGLDDSPLPVSQEVAKAIERRHELVNRAGARFGDRHYQI